MKQLCHKPTTDGQITEKIAVLITFTDIEKRPLNGAVTCDFKEYRNGCISKSLLTNFSQSAYHHSFH